MEDIPEGSWSDGNHDGRASVNDTLTTDKTSGSVHGDTPDGVLTQVLSDLEHQTATLRLLLALGELDVKGVENEGKVLAVKVNIDDGTNDGLDGAGEVLGGGGV